MKKYVLSPCIIVTTYISPTINVETIRDTTLTNKTCDLPLQQQRSRKRQKYGTKKSRKNKQSSSCHSTTITFTRRSITYSSIYINRNDTTKNANVIISDTSNHSISTYRSTTTPPTFSFQTTHTPLSSIPQPLVEVIEIVDVMTEEYGLAELFSTKY